MKKTFRFLSMAALALVGAMMTGCSNDEDFSTPQQPENKSNLVTLTATVGFDDAASTRAVSNTGVKTFAAGDQMAVIYKNTSGGTVKAVGTLTSDAGTKSGTFTFTLSSPDKTQNVTYIYPAAMAGSTGVDYTKLNSQSSGTLTDLGSKYDLATKSGAWNGDNLPTLTLENQLAILAITLKSSTDITSTITGMTINDGTNNYAVSDISSASTIYVAIQPTSGATIEVTATDGTNEYVKTLSGKTYAANNGYNVTWNMTKLQKVTWNHDDITGDPGNSFTKDGVTITAGDIDFMEKNFFNDGTFTTTLGNFTKIEVTTGMWQASGTGWSGSGQSATWTGTPASSVSFSGDIFGMGGMMGNTTFVFTIVPTN